jgi:anaerobic ribonucleoside-triphosphate reductase activating protein
MNYANIKLVDIANGPGVRVSLFVSGCRNHCKGCFNPETWDFDYGEEFTAVTIQKILTALEPPHIAGLSVLGGDPMEPENQEQVNCLCAWVKRLHPAKTIWLYTGYQFENVAHLPMMEYVDALVDGPFIEAEKDISLRFRGSRNQRIIDVRQSLVSGEVVLWKG